MVANVSVQTGSRSPSVHEKSVDRTAPPGAAVSEAAKTSPQQDRVQISEVARSVQSQHLGRENQPDVEARQTPARQQERLRQSGARTPEGVVPRALERANENSNARNALSAVADRTPISVPQPTSDPAVETPAPDPIVDTATPVTQDPQDTTPAPLIDAAEPVDETPSPAEAVAEASDGANQNASAPIVTVPVDEPEEPTFNDLVPEETEESGDSETPAPAESTNPSIEPATVDETQSQPAANERLETGDATDASQTSIQPDGETTTPTTSNFVTPAYQDKVTGGAFFNYVDIRF